MYRFIHSELHKNPIKAHQKSDEKILLTKKDINDTTCDLNYGIFTSGTITFNHDAAWHVDSNNNSKAMAFTVGFGSFTCCVIEIKGSFGMVRIQSVPGMVLMFDASLEHHVTTSAGNRISIQTYLSNRTFTLCGGHGSTSSK